MSREAKGPLTHGTLCQCVACRAARAAGRTPPAEQLRRPSNKPAPPKSHARVKR